MTIVKLPFTMTVKFVVALNGGVPLSVTTTVTVFVLGPLARPGASVIAPLFELMLIQAGVLLASV